MRSYGSGIGVVCLSLYYSILLSILDPGSRLITFSSSTGVEINTSVNRSRLGWRRVQGIDSQPASAPTTDKMEERPPLRGPSAHEAQPKLHEQAIDRQSTTASLSPPSKPESPPSLPDIDVFYPQLEGSKPAEGYGDGVEQTSPFHDENAITTQNEPSLDEMTPEARGNYFEALKRECQGFRIELKTLEDPIIYVNVKSTMYPFTHILSNVLGQIDQSIQQFRLRLESERPGNLAGELEEMRLADEEGTLAILKDCLLQFHKPNAVGWPVKQEKLVYMVLEYLFRHNLIQSEKVLDSLRGDTMMLLIVRHARMVILPLKLFNDNAEFGHEFQASWRLTLTYHTRLTYLRSILKAFSHNDWSRLMLHFLLEHYGNWVFQDGFDQKVLSISAIVGSFKELSRLQSTRIPPVHWITPGNVVDTINLFDRPIQGAHWEVDRYIASYHLLEYMLVYADPTLIHTLMTTNVMKYSIWMKRAMLKAMLNLADYARVFFHDIWNTEMLEDSLAISKDAQEHEKTLRTLGSRYSALKKASEELENYKNEKFPGTARFLDEATNSAEFKACSHELQDWLNSDLNRIIIKYTVKKIEESQKRYEVSLKFRAVRLSNAKKFP